MGQLEIPAEVYARIREDDLGSPAGRAWRMIHPARVSDPGDLLPDLGVRDLEPSGTSDAGRAGTTTYACVPLPDRCDCPGSCACVGGEATDTAVLEATCTDGYLDLHLDPGLIGPRARRTGAWLRSSQSSAERETEREGASA